MAKNNRLCTVLRGDRQCGTPTGQHKSFGAPFFFGKPWEDGLYTYSHGSTAGRAPTTIQEKSKRTERGRRALIARVQDELVMLKALPTPSITFVK